MSRNHGFNKSWNERNEEEKYTNAEKVLPRELLREIQKHYNGQLRLPAPGCFYKEVKQLMIALKELGVETGKIASLAGVTRRRVNQILAAYRKEMSPDRLKNLPAC